VVWTWAADKPAIAIAAPSKGNSNLIGTHAAPPSERGLIKGYVRIGGIRSGVKFDRHGSQCRLAVSFRPGDAIGDGADPDKDCFNGIHRDTAKARLATV